MAELGASEKEIPLDGGNVNAEVVRVGDTVRRRTSKISPTVHQLLLHLEKKGYVGSPRFLGIDEKGREILSYFAGEVGVADYLWQGDEALVAAANMLRAYHDATLDFAAPETAQWGFCYPDEQRHEVICHNDFAPYNMVFAEKMPRAIFDFDLAGPGPRLRDVAYAAYWMTPLSLHSQDIAPAAEADIKDGSRRLHLFCKKYGVEDTKEIHALFDMLAEQLTSMGDEKQMQNVVGHESAAKLKREGHLDHWQKEAASFIKNRPRLEQNLY